MIPARMLSPFTNGHESLRMTKMFLLIMFSDLHIGQSGSYQYTMLLSNMNWIALPKSPNSSVVRASDQCAEVMGLIACVAGARKGKPRASRASRFPQAWVRYLSGTSWSHKRVMLDFKPLPVYVPLYAGIFAIRDFSHLQGFFFHWWQTRLFNQWTDSKKHQFLVGCWPFKVRVMTYTSILPLQLVLGSKKLTCTPKSRNTTTYIPSKIALV